MQPIIGFTTSTNEDESVLQMNCSYLNALTHADAIPVLLPPTIDPSVITRYAQLVDGLLLSGGVDIDPLRYGENQQWDCGEISPLRDAFELAICKEFLLQKKPVLGICRGVQVMNVALGGSLYQDLQHTASDHSIAHRQKQRSCYASHPVTIFRETLLHQIFDADELPVNSLHHQAVRHIGEGLVPSACSPDGIIEAIEMPSQPFFIGVQWHPERLWDQQETEMHSKLFSAFVRACSAARPS